MPSKIILSLIALMIYWVPTFMEGSDDTNKEKDAILVDLATYYPEAAAVDPRMEAEAYTEYDRGSLFEYINGGAEAYLAMDFLRVGAREYVIALDEATCFTLDVYDMRKPLNAFGIYRAERYGNVPPVRFGVEGTLGGGSLHFWSQRYYVKIRADDEGEAVNALLKKMARHVASKIGDPGDLPVELVLFPGQYKVAAGEKYATRNLLGQKALKGFSCPYRNREAELTLYLCPLSSPKEATAAEKAFISGIKPPPRPSPEGEGFLFDDKYFGKGRCLRVGNYLAIARYGMGKKKKGGGFEKALIAEFMDRVMEAAIREKTENALEALMGGAPEKR